MKYEIFYLIGGSREADAEKIKNEIKEIITKKGGVFEEKETLEKRRLSYKVKHETHGIYIAQRFELEDAEALKDINRKINLHTGVLRFILSRADELPLLKSKEERIAEASQKESGARVKDTEKTTKKAVRTEKPSEEKEKKADSKLENETTDEKEDKSAKENKGEDIDKKLEEILNI